MSKLPVTFYRQQDVTVIARQLLGQHLVTNINGERTSGIIVETEAYAGITDRASHAWNNRRTQRTGIMYAAGGVSYIYLCYGIHYLFNVVTNIQDVPDAVLIRALQPLEGLPLMQARYQHKIRPSYTSGPGNLCKALGIDPSFNGESLNGHKVWIEAGSRIPDAQIVATPRIGVQYAGEDALRLYRYYVEGNGWVSRGK
ncbi:DNA-3-methyladenine glycosylase [Chitinophaga solisilvae]|uniref:DNA-3-methyladenine glycosylase n=1 Tax=Chitinophaga solisilvae TaxID=1233460 RepID=UPI0013704983|nr:DNA-3-methyladenine glycosylase [Chitinophaga solisilvae]